MKKTFFPSFRNTFFLSVMALVSACLMMTACGNSEENSKKEAEKENEAKFDKPSEKDAQYIVDAYAASLYEVRMADTAKKYAVTQDAITLADAVLQAHTNMSEQLRSLATAKQVSLPTDITPAQNDKLSKMTKEKKIKFDKDYTDWVVSDHKDAVSMYEKASQDAGDTDIKGWFTTTLPELRKHLDAATATKDKVKDMK